MRNISAVRRSTLDPLLAFAWDVGPFTPTDALSATGLSRSTTIDGLDQLARVGLLVELPNARAVGDYRKGRPSRRFALRSGAAVLVGVDAGRAHVVTTVADLRGERLVTRTTHPDGDADCGDDRRTLIARSVDEALAEAGRSREEVLAVCLGVPAPVDRHGRSPAHPQDFWRRMNPDLGEMLTAWAPIVRIENDACLAAIAEHAHGACVGLTDTVSILCGERLGAGIMVDGRLLRGAHGGAGEMLYAAHLSDVDSSDGLGHHLVEWANRLAESGDLPSDHPFVTLGEALTSRAVLDLADDEEPQAVALVERLGRTIARIVGALGNVCDPSRIVFCGGVAAGLEPALAVARPILRSELDLPPPDLVASELGDGVVSIGAVAAAVESARAGALALAVGRGILLPSRRSEDHPDLPSRTEA